jgi:hypothetical protein
VNAATQAVRGFAARLREGGGPSAPALFGLYALLLVLRAPTLLVSPRLWAEEATVYLAHALSASGWQALAAPHLGYYSLLPNVATLLAARVPLEWAPAVTFAVAFAVQLLPAVLVLTANTPALATPLRRGIALLLVLATVPNKEAWLNTINSQFYLAICAGLILISGPGTPGVAWLRRGVLAVGGLTGVPSLFLAPLYWLRALLERSREHAVQAVILSACGVVQLLVVVNAVEGGARALHVTPDIVLTALFVKSVVLPFLRPLLGLASKACMAAMAAGGWVKAVLLLLEAGVLGALAYGVAKSRVGAGSYLVAGAGITAVLSCVGALGDPTLLMKTTYNGRYFFVPNVFLGLALLMAVAPGSRLGPRPAKVFRVLLGWWLLMAVVNYAGSFGAFTGPSWRAEVAAWRADPAHAIGVWPPGWHLVPPGGAAPPDGK